MDRDETPIGGLEKPLPPTKQLFWVTILLDLLAIGLSLFISLSFTLGIVLYILASRAYSYRGIRLKKYPVIGFLTVFIFQGALVYYCSFSGIQQEERVSWMACIIASLLIGALYPLTQIYQHEADKKDGVTTISFLLGKRGTFFFSMALFLGAAMCLFLLFQEQSASNYFLLFLLITMPVVLFFMYWLWRVWNDENEADFKNSYRMNVIATLCTTAYFSTLIILNHFE
jgi:1,4-dihydroxy-2-naphthoate octaprenyltransferase